MATWGGEHLEASEQLLRTFSEEREAPAETAKNVHVLLGWVFSGKVLSSPYSFSQLFYSVTS